jgi:hypothetical protein
MLAAAAVAGAGVSLHQHFTGRDSCVRSHKHLFQCYSEPLKPCRGIHSRLQDPSGACPGDLMRGAQTAQNTPLLQKNFAAFHQHNGTFSL